LTTIAKAIGRGGTLVSRSQIYRALSVEAANRREDGKSVQQSFAKMIAHDPVARELFNVHQALGRRALTACDPNGPLGQEITKALRQVMGEGASGYAPEPSRRMVQPGDVDGLRGATDNANRDGDEPDLDDLVKREMQGKAGTSRSRAMVKVLGTPEGRAAYQRERTVRLNKALGH
jgi:hypothetical protein